METNIQKCTALVKVADTGSFTAASAALGYSQSSISRMVADLERDWGIRLLRRKRDGVSLTAEGQQLMPYVRRLCSQGDDLAARIDDLLGSASGTLRIGTISSIATHRLPAAMTLFHHDYPDVDYELLLGNYTEIEQWILSGRVDCGFVRTPCAVGLDTTPLEEDELFAVLPKGHPLCDKHAVTPRDLCDYPFLSLSENDDVEGAGIFEGLGVSPDTRVSTWDDYCVMAMVEKGLGISVLPGLILQRVQYDIEVRPLEPKASRKLVFAMRGDGYAPLAVQRFREYLDIDGEASDSHAAKNR